MNKHQIANNKKTENNKQIRNVCVMEPPEHVINHPYKAGTAIQGEPTPPRPSSTNPGTFEDLKQSPRTKSCVSLLIVYQNQSRMSEHQIRVKYPNRPRDFSVTIVESKSVCMHRLSGMDPS